MGHHQWAGVRPRRDIRGSQWGNLHAPSRPRDTQRRANPGVRFVRSESGAQTRSLRDAPQTVDIGKR
jgi:hypothetical protein